MRELAVRPPNSDQTENIVMRARFEGEQAVSLLKAAQEVPRLRSVIPDLRASLSPEIFNQLEATYERLVAAINETTKQFAAFGLNPGEISAGLLSRAQDIFVKLEHGLRTETMSERDAVFFLADLEDKEAEWKREALKAAQWVANYEKVELTLQNTEPSTVFTQPTLAAQDNLELDKYVAQHTAELTMLASAPQVKSLYLRAFHSRGQLAPVPELFWRVDRDLLDYDDRFGFFLPQFIKKFPSPRSTPVLLELGPGSGHNKLWRSIFRLPDDIPHGLVDIAVADKLYFPLNKLVDNRIDWNVLDQKIGEHIQLSMTELVSEALAKLIVVKDGQLGQQDLEYDAVRRTRLEEDPASIIDILQEVAPQLATTSTVPTDYSEIDAQGRRLYPRHENLKEIDSPAFKKICQLFESGGIKEVLRDHRDPYEYIPAFPAGIMIGDFSQIDHLADTSIDIGLGVRSTVYITGPEYQLFINTFINKLKPGGVYIDDNIRENFGRRYRIPELKKIKKDLERTHADHAHSEQLQFQVIMGPGVSGEDDTKGQVPMAIIISKAADHGPEIKKLLKEGYSLTPLDEVPDSFGEFV